MANTSLVARGKKHDGGRTTHHSARKGRSASAKSSANCSCPAQETASHGLSVIRETYLKHGLSKTAVDTIMQSWRSSTMAQYRPYIDLWVNFALNRCNYLTPPAKEVVEFLCDLHVKGYTYPQICMARSAVSSVVSAGTDTAMGKHPLVKRFMKGLFELEPQFPRYKFVWDVSLLFRYLRMLDEPKNLSQKLLGKKLAILICILAGGQRCQTVHAINILHVRISNGVCYIPFYTKLKQTRKGHHLAPLKFKVYTKEPKLCVITNLIEYLKKTQGKRSDGALFISSQKPHNSVSRDTVSRWVKEMMTNAGIDPNFVSHSSRSAASSFARTKGVSLKDICDACGWSNERTFAHHYQKEILGRTVAEAILN